MNKYSYRWLNFYKGTWSKRGIRVEAENSKEAWQKVETILLQRGHKGPFLYKWKYVK